MSGEDDTPLLEKAMNNWNGFRQFMWNPDEKTVMGRGGRSWAKISLFYLVFYSCLAAFWAALLGIFLQTISYDRPKWTAYVSTPGLTAVPVPDDQDRIRWTPADEDSVKRVTNEMNMVYEELQNSKSNPDSVDCASMGPGSIDEGPRICNFDVNVLGECRPPYFGWNTLQPCLFFRLNRVYNWIPEDYEAGDVPDNLVYANGNVAISCTARRPQDEFNFNNSTSFPSAGIPYGFFPHLMGAYSKDKGRSIQPVVAVKVSIQPNVAVNIRCEAFAGNIVPRGGLFDTDEKSQMSIYLTARQDQE